MLSNGEDGVVDDGVCLEIKRERGWIRVLIIFHEEEEEDSWRVGLMTRGSLTPWSHTQTSLHHTTLRISPSRI